MSEKQKTSVIIRVLETYKSSVFRLKTISSFEKCQKVRETLYYIPFE